MGRGYADDEQPKLSFLDDDYYMYGGETPHRGVETSREATTVKEASRKAKVVLNKIKARSDYGAICDEIVIETGWPNQTVSARFRELEQKGYVFKTSKRRDTSRNRSAIVYRPTEKGWAYRDREQA